MVGIEPRRTVKRWVTSTCSTPPSTSFREPDVGTILAQTFRSGA